VVAITDNQPMVEALDELVDHVRGEARAPVILEYGDYECPVLLEQLGVGARRPLREPEERTPEFRGSDPIAELNDAGANDIQPNVRKDRP
jgi:hypothetical protein